MDQRDCEIAVIGLILREPESLERVFSAGCLPEMFERDDCRAIYAEALRLMAASEPIEVTSLGARLPEHLPTLLDCLEKAPVSQNVAFYAREVKVGHHARRVAQRLSLAASRVAARKPYTPLEELRTVLAEVSSGVLLDDQDEGVTTTHQAGEELDRLTEAMLEGNGPRRITTGLPRLDEVLEGGLMRGHTCVLGARTGVGKTTVALSMAVAAAQAGCRVLFASVEMSRLELMQKVVANVGNFRAEKFREPGWSRADVDAYYRGREKAARLPIKFFDRTQRSIERVIARANLEAKTDGLDLLVIDYLQQFRTARPHDMLKVEIGRVSAMLQQMAGELNVAVLCLAQLNRQAEDGAPETRHLKECGDIEQDAGQILLMAPDVDPVLERRTGYVQIAIAKQRLGVANGVLLFKEDYAYARLLDDGRQP